MRRFYNTPQPWGNHQPHREPRTYPGLEGKELLIKLENEYSEYRESCELGYCKSDPEVHADFIAKIRKAGGKL